MRERIAHTVREWWGGLGPVVRWRELAKYDLSLPPEVGLRERWRFWRCQLACVLRGHVPDRTTLHKFERHGKRGRMYVRSACSRCGMPLEEMRGKVAQFPQPRGAEDWRRS